MDEQQLRVELTKYEGDVNHVYKDSRGYATAGIGHKLTLVECQQLPVGTVVTQNEIDNWFNADVATAERAACNVLGSIAFYELDDCRQRIMVNLAFNMGQPTLSQFHQALRDVTAHNFAAAAADLRNSLWYSQVGIRGRDIVYAMQYGSFPTP